jgi:hypothetical protein
MRYDDDGTSGVTGLLLVIFSAGILLLLNNCGAA